MTWTKLAPIAKTTGRPMASASIVVNKGGAAKVSLILAASLKDAFGDPKRCDVLAGSGEHADCLRLEFGDHGAFEVKNFVHGGARIFVPVPEGVPGKASANAPCGVVEQRVHDAGAVTVEGEPPPVDYLVLRLPVADWTRASPLPPSGGSAVKPPPAYPPGARGGALDAPKCGNGEPVDVVEYLGRKGLKVARLAGERFMLGGETVTIGAVLKEVNKHRDEAGLTPLSRAEVR